MEHTTEAAHWKDALLRDDRKEQRPFRSNIANVRIALGSCPMLNGVLRYDAFKQQIMRAAPTPWNSDLGQWDDIDDLRLTEFLQLNDINVSPEVVRHGVLLEALDRPFHRVRITLPGLRGTSGRGSIPGSPRISGHMTPPTREPSAESL